MQALEEIILNFENGIFPTELKEKTYCIKQLLNCHRYTKQSIGIAISLARKNDFVEDEKCWFDWCKREFELKSFDRDHHRQVGDLLLDVNSIDVNLYQRLFSIEFQKLLALWRIEKEQLKEFLKKYEPEKMTRDEVRTAVNKFLGKKPKEKNDKEQLLLPGFDDAVNCITNLIDDEFDFNGVVQDAAMQDNAIKSGKSLLGAAIAYESDKTIPNTKVLSDLQEDLIDTAKLIKQIIGNASPTNIILS